MHEGDPIWVLIIHHKHGENVYACATPDGADTQLYEYVKENWYELADHPKPAPPLPTDNGEAIDQYFEAMENETFGASEHYEILQMTLLP